MPPRKRTRRSGGADMDAADRIPATQAVRANSSAPPSSPQRSTTRSRSGTAAAEPVYRTRHRRVVRGPAVAAKEGGRADLVPPSDDDEYDEWRAVRAVERAGWAEGGGEDGEMVQSRIDDDAVAGPSRSSPTSTLATLPLFIPLFDDWPQSSASDGEIDWPSRTSTPSRKGKERARDLQPTTKAPAPQTRIHLGSVRPFRRELSPVAAPSGLVAPERAVRPPPEPMPPDGPDPPVQAHATLVQALTGGSWASLEAGSLPIPIEMVEVGRGREEPSPSPFSGREKEGILEMEADRDSISDNLDKGMGSGSTIEHVQDDEDVLDQEKGEGYSRESQENKSLSMSNRDDDSSHPRSYHSKPAEDTAHVVALTANPSPAPLLDDFAPWDDDIEPLPPSSDDANGHHETLPGPASPMQSQPSKYEVNKLPSLSGSAENVTPRATKRLSTPLASQHFTTETPTRPPHPQDTALHGLAATPTPVRPGASLRGSRGAPSLRPDTQAPSASAIPPPSSSPDALDLLAANDSLFNPMPAVPPTDVPAPSRPNGPPPSSQAVSARSDGHAAFNITDPALLQFRSARTFRTRTALQLQPYTKEKQLYESVLRRGGLSKGRRGIAPPSEIRAAADDKDVDDPASVGEESSSDGEHIAPEAIVIGDTQSHEQRPPRPPKKLVDADFDEYFAKFGEIPVDEDELAQRRLQAIARMRLRAEKQLMREERAAERTRRRFEALMREEERQHHAKEREEQQQRSKEREEDRQQRSKEREERRKEKEEMSRKREESRKLKAALFDSNSAPPRKQSIRPDGSKQPRTYSRKRHSTTTPNVSRSTAQPDSDSPLSSAPPSPTTATRTRLPSPPALTSPQPQLASPARFEVLSSPPRFEVLSSPESYGRQYVNDDIPDFEMLNDDRITTPVPSAPRDRTPISTKRRRVIASSSQSSDESEDEAAASRQAAVDRRRRIAERMLPRAMLKRLESEAERKQREREQRRRAAVVVQSPVRPGHAVVRRGGGAQLSNMTDLFDHSDSDDDIQEFHQLEAEEGSDGSNTAGSESDGSLGRPVVVSDTSGSEAMEDNRANDGLARLQEGDFDGIVNGHVARNEKRHAERRKHDKDRSRQRNRERRPALGLVKSVRAPPTSAPKRLRQSHIDFPIAETPSRELVKQKKASRHKQHRSHEYQSRAYGARKSKRPAIRLDDRVIFATDDFDFPSVSEPEAEVARRAAPKKSLVTVTLRGDGHLSRRTVSPSPAPAPISPVQRVQVDEGVGKARSWANFDKFPIDFDITPLPSGVFCADMIPGSNLMATLATLRGDPVDEPKPVFAFGVTLHSNMSADEILAVVPIVLEGVYDSIQTFVDAPPGASRPSLAPLNFLRDHLARVHVETQALLFPHVLQFNDRLNSISLSEVKHERSVIEQVLLARYAVFEIASIVNKDIPLLAEAVIDLLFTFGFDRTVRSLRRILRGRAETPEIKDVSISVWVAVTQILGTRQDQGSQQDLFIYSLSQVLDSRFSKEVGPLAAERIWFLIFGLCAISQFGPDGVVCAEYTPHPRWALVKRALGLIKVAHSQEAEEAARHDQLQGRDRYIKTMVARCLRLSSTWQWSFDSSSFSIATRDLGMIFKERQHRNLPTEQPTDFPRFISDFDISLTASDETRGASAFELWLRLASVAASDLIASAEELAEARKAERDVQRLIMSIFPLSAVPFTRADPPTPRQLAALINRYSTMVVACYFSPSLLPWLLANSRNWLTFEQADFNSRQICIRGLMYLAVACRHHGQPLDPVVSRLADILASLQIELESIGRPSHTAAMPTRVEIERTMVLVVSCFRQIILHSGYAVRSEPVYPDPSLLHESWTARIFQLDLAKDVKSGLEIVATIQAFLDARSAALPKRARHARETRQKESLDDYPSLGFDFDAVDLAALGGDKAPEDPIEAQDAVFAKIIRDVICPRMYRLLSDMLPPVEEPAEPAERAERLILINKLTKCWSDCAGIVVVEHQLMEWSAYVGYFGQQSWSRLANDLGRIRVGLQFMLNLTRLDPGAFNKNHEEDFIALLFQTIVTDRLTLEHKYASALFALPGASEHALFEGVSALGVDDMDRGTFMEKRGAILDVIFANIPLLLQSRWTPAAMKPLIYRCVNLLLAALAMYEGAIDQRSVLHKETYRVFCAETVLRLKRLAGDVITPEAVPALRQIDWA